MNNFINRDSELSLSVLRDLEQKVAIRNLPVAAEFVRVIQHRQGLRIACLEEIGFQLGYLDASAFEKSIARLGKSSYGNYLRSVLERRAK